jgi:hypothetical protein
MGIKEVTRAWQHGQILDPCISSVQTILISLDADVIAQQKSIMELKPFFLKFQNFESFHLSFKSAVVPEDNLISIPIHPP